jgi:hypothetical protein
MRVSFENSRKLKLQESPSAIFILRCDRHPSWTTVFTIAVSQGVRSYAIHSLNRPLWRDFLSKISRRAFELAMLGSLGIKRARSLTAMALDQPGEEGASQGCITDVPGVKVGHFTDSRRPTGCTAVLFEDGATGGVDYDGSGPEDFQAGMLQPESALQTVWGSCCQEEIRGGYQPPSVRCGTWRNAAEASTGFGAIPRWLCHWS